MDWREDFLRQVRTQNLPQTFEDAPLLEPGNSKIGKSSKLYDRVLVWNLPVVVTCPGASGWCLRHCYNADLRTEKFPIEGWAKNLAYYFQDRDGLQRRLVNELGHFNGLQAVRIHSSGDFFEIEYIRFWSEIIVQTPEIKYWAYTRSWTDEKLIEVLNEIRSLKNLQLFASWDPSMSAPPVKWRKSIVYHSDDLPSHQRGIICPEQSGQSPNCATCNYCVAQDDGDVHFILH